MQRALTPLLIALGLGAGLLLGAGYPGGSAVLAGLASALIAHERLGAFRRGCE